MKLSEVVKHINDDPELRTACYEDQRRRRAARFEAESQPQPPPQSDDREILLEIRALAQEQSELFSAANELDAQGRINCRVFDERHDRIEEISDRIGMLQQKLSGPGLAICLSELPPVNEQK